MTSKKIETLKNGIARAKEARKALELAQSIMHALGWPIDDEGEALGEIDKFLASRRSELGQLVENEP